MIVEVKMPVLGLTMEQGTIVAWLKEVGEEIAADEALLVIETDKATSDAPAPTGGILARVVAEEGDTVPVGATIAFIAETEADLESLSTSPAGLATSSEPNRAIAATVEEHPPKNAARSGGRLPGEQPAVTRHEDRIAVSPRARARAREVGVDLSSIRTDGRRIIEQDVMRALEVTALSTARRLTAQRMVLSATTIPQVTYTVRCDVTEAMDLRKTLRKEASARGITLPLDVFFVCAAARALTEFPEVNSQWVEGAGIRLLRQIAIGVAVDLGPRGLTAPVVHDAASRDLWDTAAEVDRLVSGARAGTLGPDDYAGATFTVTSLASLGIETFNPLINPPEAAILGVGAVIPTPVYREGRLVRRRLAGLALTTDHRILDGVPSARFLRRVRELVQQPSLLLRES